MIVNENRKCDVLPSVEIYTDGGCEPNPGPGGYGVVLLHPKKRAEAGGGFRLTTNNRMEIYAAIKGLEMLKQPCKITLYYKYYLLCPKCQTTYTVEEAKRFVEQPPSLF